MRAIWAIRQRSGRYKFVAQPHDVWPPPYSRLVCRCDDEDARLIVDWCYDMQRKGKKLKDIIAELE